MNGQMDLDLRLERWLVADAPLRAPDRVLAVALERVDGLAQRRPRRPWGTLQTFWRELTPSRRALLVAVGALALIVGGVAAAALLRTTPSTDPDLVVVRFLQADLPSAGFEAVAISSDGRERSLARWAGDTLEAPWNGNAAAVGSSGLLAVGLAHAPDDTVAVLDLRSSVVSPRYPDMTGSLGSWDAEGIRMARNDAHGITIGDLRTGRTTIVPRSDDVSAAVGTGWDAPVWTARGDGFVAYDQSVVAEDGLPGLIRPAPMGVLTMDGMYESGPVASVDSGLGARRLRSDGAMLECGSRSSGTCDADGSTLWADGRRYEPAYTDRDPATRIADYAWAIDGGLWLLTETVAAGPRDLALVHIDGSGAIRRVAGFPVGADDPDPNAYCSAGSFVAMAPDDSRFVISTNDPGCQTGPVYLVDVKTGVAEPVSGVVAGWLAVGALDRARPGLVPAADAPAPVRGDWGRVVDHQGPATAEDAIRVRLGRSTAELRTGTGTAISMSLAPSGDDRIVLTAFTDLPGCPAGTSGSYSWAVDGHDRLILEPVDDVCAERRALLSGTFEHTLELAGNWEPRAVRGRTYLVPEIGLRFTVASDQDSWIWSRSEKAVELGDEREGWFSMSWPTEGRTADLRGLEAGRTFIDSLASRGIRVDDWVDTTVDGRPALTGRIRRSSDPGIGDSLWPSDNGGPGFNILDGDQLTLLTDPSGRLYTIQVHGAEDAAVVAWAKALIDSIRWEGD